MRGVVVKREYAYQPYPDKNSRDLLQCSMVIINKSKGPFSFEVTERVKNILRARKTGHAGTLDPNAVGVLPIGVNKGCHVLQAISHAPKEYEGVMRVHSEVTLSQVISASRRFIGTITQLPPVRSAVKREERERDIYSLEVEDMRGRDVYFTVKCQAGTYIRKLASEWGEAMGTKAHLKELTRTLAGPYTLKDAVNIEDFIKEPIVFLKPIESAVTHLKHVWVDDNTIKTIKNGSQPFLPGVTKYDSGIKVGDLIAIMNPSQELAAIGLSLMSHDGFKGEHGQVAKLERVFL